MSEVNLANYPCSFLGDFNKTLFCLFVLHLFPHKLVGLRYWLYLSEDSAKLLIFYHKCLHSSLDSREVFACVDLEVYHLPCLTEPWRSRGVCAQPGWGRCSGLGTGSVLPRGPSGGAAVCARLCPAAAERAEGQEAVLAQRGCSAQRCPLRGLLLLPPYGTVGKGVSRADPSFTPQLFLPVHLNS